MSKAYRQRSWATTDRYRAQFRRKYRKELSRAMDEIVKPVFDDLTSMTAERMVDEIDYIIKPEPIKAFYESLYVDTGKYFARLEFAKAKDLAGNEIQIKSPVTGLIINKDNEEEMLDDIWTAGFMDFVETNMGENIVSVTGNTKVLLRKYLREILEETPDLGTTEQTRQLKEALESRYISEKKWRLNRIVRTETTTASNKGSIVGMDSTEKNYKKAWLAAFSDTRETHIAAHNRYANNPIAKDEVYEVGGSFLQYPGDPAGMVEEVVNCKCTQSFELVRE